MDSEDENIFYSLDNLNTLIENTGMKAEVAIDRYLKEVNYEPVEDFKLGLEWFNVSEPLSFAKHLKGKIVVLDFFTYCCINCMHILPDLKELESKFSIEDGLVVVGVHSAKFANEKVSNNILSAVQRYNIAHPVVNDSTCDMWKKCEVRCWPTLLVLGPNANPLIMMMGEGHKDKLIQFVNSALTYYKNKNLISKHTLPIKSAYYLLPELKGPLLFPGKIASFNDAGRDILAISDSGNSRVLIVINGIIEKRIGGQKTGFKDGNLEEAEFNQPQGLVFLNKDVLFIADTENHAVRKIDLHKKLVTTVAGNGIQGMDDTGGKIGKEQEISSPWDVCIYKTHDFEKTEGDLKEVLVIAMAGTHQIWALFLEDIVWWKSVQYTAGTVVCIAGSSKEENRNNDYPKNAGFAQPSGLAVSNKSKEIFIADSESSTVRKLSMLKGKVSAVVGGDRNPNNLFAFGDLDGSLYEAKLQHALGVGISPDENTIYVADTYNHKIKKIDISKNTVTTLNISESIPQDLKTFNEPSGLCFSSDKSKLYVTDTNNHCIKILSLEGDSLVKKITKLELTTKEDLVDSKIDKKSFELLTNKAITLSAKGGKAIMRISLCFENGLELTADAPNKWFADLPNPIWSCTPNSGAVAKTFDVIVNVVPDKLGECYLDLVLNIITCQKDACFPKNFIIRQPFKYDPDGKMTVDEVVKVILDPAKIKLS